MYTKNDDDDDDDDDDDYDDDDDDDDDDDAPTVAGVTSGCLRFTSCAPQGKSRDNLPLRLFCILHHHARLHSTQPHTHTSHVLARALTRRHHARVGATRPCITRPCSQAQAALDMPRSPLPSPLAS